MNFAEQVKAKFETHKDYDALSDDLLMMEEQITDISDDFEKGERSYTFADGSLLVWCGSELTAFAPVVH